MPQIVAQNYKLHFRLGAAATHFHPYSPLPLPHPKPRRKSSIFPPLFYDCLAPLAPRRAKSKTPPVFLSSSFMAAKLNLHCNLLLFGSASRPFLVFPFCRFYGPEMEMKTHELSQPESCGWGRDKDVLLPGHMLPYTQNRIVCASLRAACRTNCAAKVRFPCRSS